MQNRLVTSPLFRVPEKRARGSPRPSHKSPNPPRLEALLVTAEAPDRITEGPRELGLTGIPGFGQRDHRIDLGSSVLHAVVCEDHTMHTDDALGSLRPERHRVADEDRAVG